MQPGSGPAPTRRILVVDDNRDAAESLAMLLRVYGHDVRVAHDGLTALAVARAFHPEIVLLDLNLPRLDGRQVARQMRHEEGLDKALLVAVTGYPDEDEAPPEESDFDASLSKPTDFEQLRALLARGPVRG